MYLYLDIYKHNIFGTGLMINHFVHKFELVRHKLQTVALRRHIGPDNSPFHPPEFSAPPHQHRQDGCLRQSPKKKEFLWEQLKWVE